MSPTLLYGDSYRNPNLFYATGFLAPDPIVFLADSEDALLAVPRMEQPRAAKESRIGDVRSFDELGYQEVVDEGGSAPEAMARVIREALDGRGEAVRVEPGFPLLLADLLRSEGLTVSADPDLLVRQRRQKSDREVEALARAQARAEAAIAHAIEILREAEVAGDRLVYRGVPLTAERLRGELEISFIRDGFAAESLIVAPGPGSSDPHWVGAGPIRPHEPLILDLFPQDRESRYYGDVTRTVVKGEPPRALIDMHSAVLEAQERALALIGPGVNGRDVHQVVLDVFQEAGYGPDGHRSGRFTHGTGHGLGLEVHEPPRLSKVDGELLVGDVVTVEPGLYDPQIGGVRIEDVVVVTQDGTRNLNRLPKQLVID